MRISQFVLKVSLSFAIPRLLRKHGDLSNPGSPWGPRHETQAHAAPCSLARHVVSITAGRAELKRIDGGKPKQS